MLVPLQRWVRRRCRQGGIPPPSSVHLVSSLKGRGVRELLQDVQALAGPRQAFDCTCVGQAAVSQPEGTGGPQWENRREAFLRQPPATARAFACCSGLLTAGLGSPTHGGLVEEALPAMKRLSDCCAQAVLGAMCNMLWPLASPYCTLHVDVYASAFSHTLLHTAGAMCM